MSDNNVSAAEPAKKKASGGGFKEWLRKQTINLKRKPQNIGFLVVIITTAFNLLTLGTYSEAIQSSGAGSNVDWVGLMVFANTLFSLLVVVAFMNSFPKMKKYNSKTTLTVHFTKASKININTIMAAVYLIFCIVMIVCEFIYRTKMTDYCNTNLQADTSASARALVETSITYSLVHIILLIVDIVLFLLTPIFGKLLAKIDTSKELESAVSNMQEIDLASEE